MSEPRRILVIGIGAGNPEFLTLQAIDALNRADVIFIPDKGDEKSGLREFRDAICERFIRGEYRRVEYDVPVRRIDDGAYKASVDEWRDEVEQRYTKLLGTELRDGEIGAFLVWGDPAIYDGTMRMLDGLIAGGIAIEYEVIPGISAMQAMAAGHHVPFNGVGEPVTITTGRKLAAGEAGDSPNVIVMLDTADAHLAAPDDAEIFWSAYAGMPQEVRIAGRVGDVKEEIAARRAALREEHGWVMDTYLLRRPK